MGTRLKDIVFDRHEDHLYEDERAMRLTPYVMSERCLQVEAVKIYDDYKKGDTSTLTDPAVVDELIENRQNRGGR